MIKKIFYCFFLNYLFRNQKQIFKKLKVCKPLKIKSYSKILSSTKNIITCLIYVFYINIT